MTSPRMIIRSANCQRCWNINSSNFITGPNYNKYFIKGSF